MNTIPCLHPFRLLLTLSLFFVAGCATTGQPKSGGEATARTNVVTTATGRVTLEQGPESLANTARSLGVQKSGGIVVMHGLGFESLPALSWKDRKFEDAVHELAGHAGSGLSMAAGYAFLHPMGYEVLNAWDTAKVIPPALAQQQVAIAFGNGTKLSSAMAFLSQVSGQSILVDNAVADARTGEVWLPTLPLSSVLDAILKSARVPPESVAVESAEGLVFIRSRGNRSAPLLLGAQDDSLNKRVSVFLPKGPENDGPFPFYFNAIPLGELLPTLSRQLGVPVTAGAEFEVLPVEQSVWMNQPREQVIKYLIAQWPAPGIGYRWDGQGIVIERYTPAPK